MTKLAYSLIGNQFISDKKELAQKMLEELILAHPDNLQYQQKETQAQIIHIFEVLIEFLGEYVIDPEQSVLERAKSWGESVGFMSVKAGGSLENALANMTLYKKCLWEFIQRIGSKENLKSIQITDIFIKIDEVFNVIVFGFSHAFSVATEQKILHSRAEFIRLSIPIVPLLQGMAVLPLVGEIDDVRASILIEETLEKCKNLSISKLIIDFSGVYQLDSTAVHTTELLLRSLKLIGITPVITGLRPELSIQFITSGLVLKDIEISGSIEQVLQEL